MGNLEIIDTKNGVGVLINDDGLQAFEYWICDACEKPQPKILGKAVRLAPESSILGLDNFAGESVAWFCRGCSDVYDSQRRRS